jgi:hypothetical protein
MRNMTPKDYQQMLGDRDAIIFLLDEENMEMKEQIATFKRVISEQEQRLIETNHRIEELNGKLVQSDTE